jgi:hypothetical protein
VSCASRREAYAEYTSRLERALTAPLTALMRHGQDSGEPAHGLCPTLAFA